VKLLRAVNLLAGLCFVTSAALQWNDPDPLRWAAMYLAAAVACLLFHRGRMHRAIPVAVGAVALVWALVLAPEVIGKVAPGELVQSMRASGPLIEMGRELGGLALIVVWMAALALAREPGIH